MNQRVLIRQPRLIQPYQIASHKPLSTGAPYHFSDTPWELKDYKLMGDDQDEILKEIGWES